MYNIYRRGSESRWNSISIPVYCILQWNNTRSGFLCMILVLGETLSQPYIFYVTWIIKMNLSHFFINIKLSIALRKG